MRKNAFTLVELLVVIVLLGIIAVIAFPIVQESITESKESLNESQLEIITSAAKNWTLTNNGVLPMSESEGSYNLPLSKLSEDGYIDSDELIDPRDNKPICGYIQITYNDSKNQYNYKFVKETC